MLLEDHIFPNIDLTSWHDWRKKELWTLEINDLLEANKQGLRKLYKSYYTSKKKYMTFQDAKLFATKDTGLDFSEKDFIYAYGMSKMTNTSEIETRWKYAKLEYVEFLEFLARLAESKYKDEDNLLTKLCKLLDIVFRLVGWTRKEPKIEVQYISESEKEFEDAS